MTKPAKIILICIGLAAAAMILVVVTIDQGRLSDAARLRTDRDFDEFAHRSGSQLMLIRNHGAYTFIVRVP